MTKTETLTSRCAELFAGYPLAVDSFDGAGYRWMTLMVADDDGERFFRLHAVRGAGTMPYGICRWDGRDEIDVLPVDGAVPADMEAAIKDGVPLPRDGAMLGWARGGHVTCLVVSYTDEDVPGWSVVPLAGTPEGAWPPFTGDRLLGASFWEHHEAGRLVDLRGLVGGTRNAVFWVPARTSLGSGITVVTTDIASPQGYTLPRGRYAYYKVLQGGEPLPSLDDLLTDPARVDLGPRFPLGSDR